MSAEKQNRESGLEEKLNALFFLPGEQPLHKEVAWNNLYHRLEAGKLSYFRWNRVAAACLLLAGASFFWMNVHRGKPEVQPKQTETAGRGIPADPPMTSIGDRPATALHIKINGKSSARPPVRSGLRKTLSPMPPSVRPTPRIPDTGWSAFSSVPPVKIIAAAPLTVTDNTVATLPKKKLRVVHLNEIDEPAETETVARSAARHLFRMRWPRPPTLTNSSSESDPPAYEMLRINLSSPN